MPILSIDVETASLADLRKTGASRYSRDASTMITVIAWAFDDGPVQSVVLPKEPPEEIVRHFRDDGRVQAWNANFEQNILENVWGLRLPPGQWSCTMQRAMHGGLPAALGECGPALGLDIVKDTTAHALMLRMCKPRSIEPLRWWHDEDTERLERLRQYCVRDVEAEREIARNIPKLAGEEVMVSILDRVANSRGVRIDRRAVERMLDVAADATRALSRECADITAGAVKSPGTNPGKLLQWLGQYAPEDLTKESVSAALKRDDLPSDVRRVLEIRQEVAKASTKKLNAMIATMDDDDRIRGALQYYGASRTGRWSGKYIQPQNLPRPTIKKPNEAIDFMLKGAGADMVEAFYGAPLDVVASCLRGMLIPSDGYKFVGIDLSQIEARMLAWMAGQDDVVQVFRNKEDVYTHAQKKIGLNSRQEGKVATLGLGYGMGPPKFIATAATYGLTYDEDRATEIVKGWRAANPKIVSFWYRTDDAVKEAIGLADSKRVVTIAINDKTSVTVSRAKNREKLMTLLLPSGRRLFYRNVALEEIDGREAITFWGVDQKTKRWTKLRTWGSKLVENVVQAASRDVICDMALTIDECEYGDLVLSVHDELVYEVPADEAGERFGLINEIMNTSPEWADGCPIAADGHILDRYGK